MDKDKQQEESTRFEPWCIERLMRLKGTYIGRSRFGKGQAVFRDGTEIAHFHSDGAIDLRLGKHEIVKIKKRDDVSRDIVFRRGSSDWVEILPTELGRTLVEEFVRSIEV